MALCPTYHLCMEELHRINSLFKTQVFLTLLNLVTMSWLTGSFDIDVELNKRGANLNIPPFRNQNFQLSSEQVETTRRIAEVRIHVERTIQRMKPFHILDKTMPLSLHIVADDIFKICALLTNFQTPKIK